MQQKITSSLEPAQTSDTVDTKTNKKFLNYSELTAR